MEHSSIVFDMQSAHRLDYTFQRLPLCIPVSHVMSNHRSLRQPRTRAFTPPSQLPQPQKAQTSSHKACSNFHQVSNIPPSSTSPPFKFAQSSHPNPKSTGTGTAIGSETTNTLAVESFMVSGALSQHIQYHKYRADNGHFAELAQPACRIDALHSTLHSSR